jgi:hypothetical protein
MGASPLRWGVDLSADGAARTGILLWVEVDRRGPMRALPAPMLRRMIRGVNDREIATIKQVVEAGVSRETTPAG